MGAPPELTQQVRLPGAVRAGTKVANGTPSRRPSDSVDSEDLAEGIGAPTDIPPPSPPSALPTLPACDIDVIDAEDLTADEIHSRYISRGRPLAITNATARWKAKASLARDSFRATFATVQWEPQLLLPGKPEALAPYMDRAARGEIRRPLSFNRPSDPTALQVMQGEVPWPAVLGGAANGRQSNGGGGRAGLDFFAGPNRSGTPLHHHSAVWNALIYGRKLWALVPPSRASFGKAQKEHPLDSEWHRLWKARAGDAATATATGKAKAKAKAPSKRYLYCEQAAGTLLYLPSSWAHATLNLEEGLAVGGFLHDEATLGLHMQVVHAPRGIGSLQNAPTIHQSWYQRVGASFPG